jgi:hypothetical protein
MPFQNVVHRRLKNHHRKAASPLSTVTQAEAK